MVQIPRWNRIATCCTGFIFEGFPNDGFFRSSARNDSGLSPRQLINRGLITGDNTPVVRDDYLETFSVVLTTTTNNQQMIRDELEKIGFVPSPNYSKNKSDRQREKGSGGIQVHTIHAVDLWAYAKSIQKETEKEIEEERKAAEGKRRFGLGRSNNPDTVIPNGNFPHATEEDFFESYPRDLNGYPHNRNSIWNFGTVGFDRLGRRYGLTPEQTENLFMWALSDSDSRSIRGALIGIRIFQDTNTTQNENYVNF